MIKKISVASSLRNEMIEITAQVRSAIKDSAIKSGLAVVFSTHTTAGVTINENADPDVRRDLTDFLGRLVPIDAAFRHGEGNSDAHIKTTLTGASVTLLVEDGAPVLGTWQGVFLCEFDGPRRRTVLVKTVSG